MEQQVRNPRLNLNVTAMVVWTMYAAVVCYAISVWLAVGVIEQGNAFAAFSGNIYWFAAALSVVIACAIGFAVMIVAPVVTRVLRGTSEREVRWI